MERFAPHLNRAVRCGAALFLTATAQTAEADGAAFFESKIRPLLVERCMECHGEKKQKGGLRLDSRAAWQQGGDSGAAIKPGDLEASLLIKAVRYADKDLQMPPKKQLTAEEVAALEQWVKIGAPDPRETNTPAIRRMVDFEAGRKHWAFQPVGDPQPPTIAGDEWSQREVDRFIFARLRQAGLQPSAPSDRRTLIRRATFDLTGLPPTTEEVTAFVQDESPEAFAKVVDRLLASPHYGEHWARHWLDVARYSDMKGYVYAREEKRFVHAWPYRDWVVQALNDDLPYDRFLLLQLAADQVEPAGSPNLAAMGFLTLGRRFLGVTHDIIDDRIDVVMAGMQALTVACARCHDHKFDPISTRDYYALYGVFQSCAERLVPAGPDAASDAFAKELRTREQKLRDTLKTRREEQSARVRAKVTEHLLAQFELEKYPADSFGQILTPADINPVFVRRWQSFLVEAGQRRDPVFAAWHEFGQLKPADFASKASGVVQSLQQKPATEFHPRVAEAFATAPVTMREVAERYGALFSEVEKQWRVLLKTEPNAKELPDAGAEVLRRVLYGPESPCSVADEHIANIENDFPNTVTVELWKLQGEVDRWLLDSAEAPAHATILADRAKPSVPRVFKRGNALTPGEEVPRRFLQVLSGDQAPPFAQGSGRLELARAIAAPSNPLTARVIVNRVWMQHFGRGLVATPSNFGTRAEPPSHPELLDWLARRFMDDGWSLKALHRRLMLSATYQQSSVAPADAAALAKAQQLDPDNRLLWRMNTHRLGVEEMRDAWLAATGEIDLRVGGKPADLLANDNVRRTLYALVNRENLSTVLRNFDFANPDLSIPLRSDTIVPQQALFGLNHPFVAARANALARKTAMPNGADDTARVRRMYELLYQRPPQDAEIARSLEFVKSTPAPPIRSEVASAWQYGYGEFDETTGRLKSFTALPHFSGTDWQGGAQWPDAKLGWLQLTATGGHPGNTRKHAVVRRWVAPREGRYTVASTLIHEPEVGDGIRAFISHSGQGLLRFAALHHSKTPLNIEALPLNAGETLDFIVDIRDGLNSDQFLWSPKITLAASAGSGEGGNAPSWDAQKDFTPHSITPLEPWSQLAQALMLSNEFMFVD